MTLTPMGSASPTKVAGYSLTKHALEQAAERGINHDQLATVLMNPAYRLRNGSRSNDNITVFIDEHSHVITAVLRYGEIEALAEATRKRPAPVVTAQQQPEPERRRRPRAPVVARSHILDSIHPALRDEITRLVDGDFSRLVINSPTNVSIKPL